MVSSVQLAINATIRNQTEATYGLFLLDAIGWQNADDANNDEAETANACSFVNMSFTVLHSGSLCIFCFFSLRKFTRPSEAKLCHSV